MEFLLLLSGWYFKACWAKCFPNNRQVSPISNSFNFPFILVLKDGTRKSREYLQVSPHEADQNLKKAKKKKKKNILILLLLLKKIRLF